MLFRSLINRLQRNGRDIPAKELIELYAPISVALNTPVEAGTPARTLLPRLAAARRTMEAQAPILRQRLTTDRDARDFDTGATLLDRFAEELYAYVDVAALLQAPGGISGSAGRVRFTRGNDFYGAGLATLRTTLTMAALSVFWIASAWPYGSSAMLLATIFAGLFATAPNPTQAVKAICLGYLLGMSASFLCVFFVLTRMDGYGLLVAGSAPFLMIGLVMMTWPAVASVGLGYAMGFAYILALKNQMVFDPVHFMNDMIAQLTGLGFAGIAFAFVPPAIGSLWFRRRQLERLRRQVAVAAEAPLPGLRHRFESVNHDLFGQIVSQTEPGSNDSRMLLAWALAVHETGRAVIQLRSDMADGHWPDDEKHAITSAIGGLARLYEYPSAATYLHARDTLVTAIDVTSKHAAAHPLLNHLHLLRMALLDEQSALAEYMPQAPRNSGVQHAT